MMSMPLADGKSWKYILQLCQPKSVEHKAHVEIFELFCIDGYKLLGDKGTNGTCTGCSGIMSSVDGQHAEMVKQERAA